MYCVYHYWPVVVMAQCLGTLDKSQTGSCAPEGHFSPLRACCSIQSRLIKSQVPPKKRFTQMWKCLVLLPKPAGPSTARGDAPCKIYGRPNFPATGWKVHANGSFVISDCNNCKGRWSCISGLFNQSYLLSVINTLITVATRTRANLCTRKSYN